MGLHNDRHCGRVWHKRGQLYFADRRLKASSANIRADKRSLFVERRSMASMDTEWKTAEQLLADGVVDLELSVSARAQRDMIAYLRELETWNASYNLTAIRAPVEMVVKHLLDSLAVLPYLGEAKHLLDVGTGAGLPGIPLAICLPRLEVTLLDSNGKKAAFLRHCVRSLGLKNVQVVQGRVEAHVPAKGFDVVISRAYAALDDFIATAGHCCADDGRVLAMMGAAPDAALLENVQGFNCQNVAALPIPGLGAERHLAILARGLI